MKPAPIAKKLKRPGRKVPPQNATMVRTTAAKKQTVERMRRCRSTRSAKSKIAPPNEQLAVSRQHVPNRLPAAEIGAAAGHPVFKGESRADRFSRRRKITVRPARQMAHPAASRRMLYDRPTAPLDLSPRNFDGLEFLLRDDRSSHKGLRNAEGEVRENFRAPCLD